MNADTASPTAAVDGRRVRQLRIQSGLGTEALARRARISRTTLHYIEKGLTPNPRARTLHKLATALGVVVEALLESPAGRLGNHSRQDNARVFDRRTNVAVEEAREQAPEVFEEFTDTEWDELYSEHGMGGALTAWGAAAAARRINRKRHTLRRLALVLETHLEQVATALVEALYESVRPPRSHRPTQPIAPPFDKGG